MKYLFRLEYVGYAPSEALHAVCYRLQEEGRTPIVCRLATRVFSDLNQEIGCRAWRYMDGGVPNMRVWVRDRYVEILPSADVEDGTLVVESAEGDAACARVF